MDARFYVYMLASRERGTLYIGTTSDLARRVWQHRAKEVEGFTKDYGVTRLVWFEVHESAEGAAAREKRMKKWNRAWKIDLIEQTNPNWQDLYDQLTP